MNNLKIVFLHALKTLFTGSMLLCFACQTPASKTQDAKLDEINNMPKSAQAADLNEASSSFTPEDQKNAETLFAEFTKAGNYPGMAVGLVSEGKLIWAKTLGNTQEDKPIDKNTVFRIGSITKVFTSIGVLQLQDEGKLKLEDPVSKYIPELEKVLSSKKTPVSILHLLTHSSGIPTLGDGSLDWTTGKHRITEEELITSVQNAKLQFEPGSQFDYSNVGMALAGVVISRASDMPYRDFVQKNLLDPLDMKSTYWEKTKIPDSLLAQGHWKQNGKYVAAGPHWILGAVEPAGGLYSTLEDMAKFVSFAMGDTRYTSGENKVLSLNSLQNSQKPQNIPPGHTTGIGWALFQGPPEVGYVPWHNGSTLDYGAWMAVLPQKNLGVITLLNTGNLSDLNQLEQFGANLLRIAAHFPIEKPKKHSETPTAKETIDTSIKRILSLIENPKGNYQETFSAGFLTQKPEKDLQTLFTSISSGVGTCKEYEILEDRGEGNFIAKLQCEKANLRLQMGVQNTPPYHIGGILIQPAE